jgi:hypothetical protein
MVHIYTLVNGEQIIGVDNGNKEYVTIKDPYYIMESQDEYGNNGMKLINVCTFSKEQCIVVNDKHIVFSTEASERMSEYYQKLVDAYNNKDISTMIEESIKEMEDMDNKMRKLISKRLVGGSKVN